MTMAMDSDSDKAHLARITNIMNICTDILGHFNNQEAQFKEIKKLINSLYNVQHWSILRLDEATNQLFFTLIQSTKSNNILKQIPIRLGEGICGAVAKTGVYQIVTEINEDYIFTKSVDTITQFKTESIVAVPIRREKKIIGVLELVNLNNPKVFQKNIHERRLLQSVADFVGLVFYFSSAQKEIIFSLERDTLTGLYNRRYLKSVYDKDKKHGLKKDTMAMFLIMIDLNGFKEVNDTLGHLVGDQILIETARLLKAKFRKRDVIIRYGGDEFIILIETKRNKEQVIQSMTKKLKSVSRALPYSCSLAYGIACGDKNKFHTLLEEADKIMYKHKRMQKTL